MVSSWMYLNIYKVLIIGLISYLLFPLVDIVVVCDLILMTFGTYLLILRFSL
jgi:hypothetical protein